jgi:hypothetical protein
MLSARRAVMSLRAALRLLHPSVTHRSLTGGGIQVMPALPDEDSLIPSVEVAGMKNIKLYRITTLQHVR